MDFITGRAIPRRTFLRGVGASISLPFLDAMVPVGRLARAAEDPTRLVCIEMVHGAAGASEWGASQNFWSPAEAGKNFDLSPSALRSLDPYRKYLTIVSDTDVRMAEAFEPDEVVSVEEPIVPQVRVCGRAQPESCALEQRPHIGDGDGFDLRALVRINSPAVSVSYTHMTLPTIQL